MKNSNIPPISEEQLSQLMDGEWEGLNSSECVAGICDDEKLRNKWSRYHLIRDCMKSEPISVNNQLLSNISAAIADEPTYSNISQISATSAVGEASENRVLDDQSSEKSDEVVGKKSDSVTPFVAKAKTAAQPSTKSSFWSTGIKGFAVAASVAAVTVVGMNVWQEQNLTSNAASSVAVNTAISADSADAAFSQQIDGAQLPEVDFVANTGAFWVSPQTAERVSDEERLNMFLSQHLENSPTASREGLMSYSRLVGYDDDKAAE